MRWAIGCIAGSISLFPGGMPVSLSKARDQACCWHYSPFQGLAPILARVILELLS
jgi:hypothetical protein